jgi:hypothetical protein
MAETDSGQLRLRDNPARSEDVERTARRSPPEGLLKSPRVLVAIVAMTVAVTVLGVIAIRSMPQAHRSSSSNPVLASAGVEAGKLWALRTASGPFGSVDVKSGHPETYGTGTHQVWIYFASNTEYFSNDSVNVTQGNYEATPSGFLASFNSTGLVGLTDVNSWRSHMAEAMNILVQRGENVTVVATDQSLVLSSAGYTLTFDNASIPPANFPFARR